MLGCPPVTRRTVLGFFGTLLSLVFAASAGNAAEASESPLEKRIVSERGGRFGVYNGTVDRIVGGEHVVLLVEADGEVIDQHVLSAASYPDLTEGDPISCVRHRGKLLWVRAARRSAKPGDQSTYPPQRLTHVR